MKFVWVLILIAIVANPANCRGRISSDQLKAILSERSLTGIEYEPPRKNHRGGTAENQLDCALRLYTGRFWLLDQYLQSINNVTSFLTCVKKCYEYPGCKSINYVQGFEYCELEAVRFVDDQQQSTGILGELNEIGQSGHADLIECKDLPAGILPPPSSPPASSTPAIVPPTSTLTPPLLPPTSTPTTAAPVKDVPLGTTTTQVPELSTCGKAHYPPKITADPQDPSVLGVEPVPNSWPWTVNIFYQNQHRCTGSLLRINAWSQQSDVVLTTASCLVSSTGATVSTSGVRVILGGHRINETIAGQVISGVSTIVQMPDYNSALLQKDMALLKLEKPVKFTAQILPACLLKPGEGFTIDKLCVATGWGNQRLDMENLMIQQRITPTAGSKCSGRTICKAQVNSQQVFCGGMLNGPGPAKNIDAGSPITCLIDEHWIQVGMAATVNEMACLTGDQTAINIFTRISYFRDWIDENVAKLSVVQRRLAKIRTQQ